MYSLFAMTSKLALVSTLLLGLVSAAPSSSAGGASIVIKNQCKNGIEVSKMTNGQMADTAVPLAAGAEKKYPLPDKWSGRFWARENCTGDGCQVAGAAFPASLAEFTFKGAGGNDYYDLSFVDGYNLPISIVPISPSQSGGADNGPQYHCGSPTCKTAPACPSELEVKDNNGTYIGCASACSKFNTEEYCCSGAHSTPQTCSANKYSLKVKSACPNVYTYAYDDKTSIYMCQAQGYTVTFCPA